MWNISLWDIIDSIQKFPSFTRPTEELSSAIHYHPLHFNLFTVMCYTPATYQNLSCTALCRHSASQLQGWGFDSCILPVSVEFTCFPPCKLSPFGQKQDNSCHLLLKAFWEVNRFLGSLYVIWRWQNSWEFIRLLTVWFALQYVKWVMCLMTYELGLQVQETFLSNLILSSRFLLDASISKALLHWRHENAAVRKLSSGKSLWWKVTGFYKPFCPAFISSLRFAKSEN